MIPFLRSLLFALTFYGGSVFAVLGALPVSLFGAAAVQRYGVGWVRFHGWCARTLLGIRNRIEGDIPAGPILFAAKHQSMYETLELLHILDMPAVIFKKELAEIPLWGTIAMRYGAIPVDRSGSARALREMARRANTVTAGGRPIIFFPEGTRVSPGQCPPLRPGFAGLYRLLGMTVVPIALNSGLLSRRRSFIKLPGTVTFRFGEPIPPGLPRAEVEARVHAAINALER